MRIWFDKVTKRDARWLCRWWNNHGRPSMRGERFFAYKREDGFWDVWRQA